MDLDETAKDLGIDAGRLSEILEHLGSEQLDLGRKAFKAAQEAKTFQEAIDSVKDAVSTGWMNTFEKIFGNYEEAKVLWTDLANELYEVFATGGERRNELLDEWRELGGRDDLIQAFWNIFHAITDTVAAIKEAWRSIFPPKTAKQLADATKRFREFTERLKGSGKIVKFIQNIFKRFFGILKIGVTIIKGIFTVLSPIFSVFGKLVKAVSGVNGGFSDFILHIAEALEKSTIFDRGAQKVSDALSWLSKRFGGVIDWIKSFVKALSSGDIFDWFSKNIHGAIDWLKEFEAAFKEAMAHDGPFLINAVIDQDEPVLPLLPAGGSMENIITKFEKKEDER